jgi:hypothetical protein
MPRQANAVDFWRGFALITIFIDHIPGQVYANYTLVNYSFSDAADLFVFLAGWSLRLMADGGSRRMPTRYVVLRLFGRALELYAAQVLITMLAIAMLALTSIELDNPLLLEWHNAAAVFNDPVPTHIGLALLSHQLGYFDILPLYVVLMLMAPVFAVIDRWFPNWVLVVSLAIYITVLATVFDLPTWPVEGQWFFNPLAWQLTFVLGFVLAKPEGLGGFVRRHIVTLRWIALPIVVFFLILVWFNIWHDPTKMPQPRLFFILDKTFASPLRIIQFLALVTVMSVAFPYIRRAVPPLVSFLCLLGRNSLYVFCTGSLLSLTAQIVRNIYRGNFVIDTVTVVIGVALMALVAWLPEWRENIRLKPQRRPQPVS